MARVTVEDCLERNPNRYGLVHIAAKRARQLLKGSEPLVKGKNKSIVMSLREVAEGKVKAEKNKQPDPSEEEDDLAALN